MRGPKTIIAAGAAALLAGGGSIAAQQAPPMHKAEARFAPANAPLTFELFRGNRIVFAGTVNGKPAEIMLDSGAAISVINTRFAATAGIVGGQTITARGASGTMPGQLASGVALAVGPLTLRSTVMLLDLADIERGVGRNIDVILGRDAFEAGIVDIDFEKREIRFLPAAGFAPPAGAVKVAM
jgi:hypothetical protein